MRNILVTHDLQKHYPMGDVVVRALEMLARRGEVDAGAPKEAIEKYRLLDVNAGTTGNTGGDA